MLSHHHQILIEVVLCRRVLLIANHFPTWCDKLLHNAFVRCVDVEMFLHWRHLEQLGRRNSAGKRWSHKLRSGLRFNDLIFLEVVFAIDDNSWMCNGLGRAWRLVRITVDAVRSARGMLLSQLNLALLDLADFILNPNQSVVCRNLQIKTNRELCNRSPLVFSKEAHQVSSDKIARQYFSTFNNLLSLISRAYNRKSLS